MIKDPELEKLVIEGKQKIVQEFAEKFANLTEKVRRVPQREIDAIVEKFSCPPQIASVAYVINLEGLLFLNDAIDLLTAELYRRNEVREEIPNIPGSIMTFAINEGQWIEYLYGAFSRHLELKTRELANLEQALEEENPSVEKTLPILQERIKLAETYIAPAIETWLKEHVKSNGEDALITFGPALTKWKTSSVKGKIPNIRRRNQALFRKFKSVLTVDTTESATIDLIVKRIDLLLEDLENPVQKMSVRALSHILLHIAPRLAGRGDRTRYVDHGVKSTRGNKTEPDMSSPFDFLERDVRLGKRRSGKERDMYLTERIGRVFRVLRYQGFTQIESIDQCTKEIEDRLHLEDIPTEEFIEKIKFEIVEIPNDERDSYSIQRIYDYVVKYAYGE